MWGGEALCWVTLEEPQMWAWGLLLKLGRGVWGSRWQCGGGD